MVGISERNKQKVELVNQGFSLRYIDEWQPKVTLYRHKASMNTQNEVVREIGTTVKGVPGNPDYVLRKSKIGLFPWKPGEECKCKWCREGDWSPETPDGTRKFCDVCGLAVEAQNSAGASSKLTFHKRASHPEL